tara:strand:+ start:1409 stop:1663 length:255 start_codon:yes stop_codon:yes gene_type:complete
MKLMENHYFIDQLNVIIDGIESEIVTITGSGAYDPNMVKRKAIEMVKEKNSESKFAAIIISHEKLTLEEYQNKIGKNPPWLGNL